MRRIQILGDEPKIHLEYFDENRFVLSTIPIYKAPDRTVGLKFIFDEKGNPIVVTNTDNPYAVYELSEPSDSYTKGVALSQTLSSACLDT